MSERMTDGRLADLEEGFGFEDVILELVEALKAERAKVAELEDIIICLETDMPMAVRLLNQRTSINRLTDKNSVLEATIERVSPLPDKWRNSTDVIQASGFGMAGLVQYTITPRDCADELEAALKESGDE